MQEKTTVCEGDIHEFLTVEGRVFEIRYGYYADYERNAWEPIPIYPDFSSEPMYTEDGRPYVTQMQDSCKSYVGLHSNSDHCCACCKFSSFQRPSMIGVCAQENNKKHREVPKDEKHVCK